MKLAAGLSCWPRGVVLAMEHGAGRTRPSWPQGLLAAAGVADPVRERGWLTVKAPRPCASLLAALLGRSGRRLLAAACAASARHKLAAACLARVRHKLAAACTALVRHGLAARCSAT
ncbi:hypothetical protein Dimus_033479 [Dionaea muscipula]